MKFDIKRVKIFVTVPKENAKEVKKAMFDAGAGVIGNYSCCSTSVESVGTYTPNEKANPYYEVRSSAYMVDNTNPNYANRNNIYNVKEVKIEVVCDVKDVKNVIKRLREVHPYEEPGIDIIPLIDESDFI